MKYNYKFKLNAVEMYRLGQWIDTPDRTGVFSMVTTAKIAAAERIKQRWILKISSPRN